MPRHQPVTKRERRPAIVFVVVGDGIELLRIALLHPALVREDRADALANVRLSRIRDERFDLLQRVALDARAQALAHHGVQIDEDAAAQ